LKAGKKYVTKIDEQSKCYVRNRQDIWYHVLDMNLKILPRWLKFAAHAKARSIPIPDIQVIENVILNTPDTSQGNDGIPYAFCRLAHVEIALLIRDIIIHIATCTIDDWSRVPWQTQLLIWIAKIDGAETPEDMRPLALPETLMRILAAVLHVVARQNYSELLHPAQALVGEVKVKTLSGTSNVPSTGWTQAESWIVRPVINAGRIGVDFAQFCSLTSTRHSRDLVRLGLWLCSVA